MIDPSFGPRDPLSDGELAATVSAVRPDWRLVDADPMPDGSDIVYGVTVTEAGDDGASDREAVLKCFRPAEGVAGRSPERFLVEVGLLDLASRDTALPVPEVYGVCPDDDDLPTPAFLMERLPGESVAGVHVADDGGVADPVVRECGRYLARIHDLRSFETSGDLVAVADESGRTDAGGPVVADGRDAWERRLRDLVTAALDDLDASRFADLESGFREYADGQFDALALDAEAVLLHGDYRPGNLLADPESGAVTAVLDWGAAQAGDRRYELAWAVREFSRQAPVGSPARERVRETLLDAYETERGVAFDRDATFERRQRFYLAVTWVAELQWLDYWWGGAEASAREQRAARLRENLERLL